MQVRLSHQSPLNLEKSFPNSVSGVAPTEKLGVANITNEFILELDTLRAYDASVDLGRQKLCLAEEGVLLWRPGAGPRPSSLVVAKVQVIPA